MICLSSPAACPPIYISHGYRKTKARYYLKTPAKKKKKREQNQEIWISLHRPKRTRCNIIIQSFIRQQNLKESYVNIQPNILKPVQDVDTN